MRLVDNWSLIDHKFDDHMIDDLMATMLVTRRVLVQHLQAPFNLATKIVTRRLMTSEGQIQTFLQPLETIYDLGLFIASGHKPSVTGVLV